MVIVLIHRKTEFYGNILQKKEKINNQQHKTKKPSISWAFSVPRAGLEPARPQWPQDFKSCVSTSSTTKALIWFYVCSYNTKRKYE